MKITRENYKNYLSSDDLYFAVILELNNRTAEKTGYNAGEELEKYAKSRYCFDWNPLRNPLVKIWGKPERLAGYEKFF